jgi:RNA polymerase sigma-70 factor (ECF subfamily)
VTDRSHEDAQRAVESAARESYGRLVAFLSARTRDVAAAEDALGEALVAALATWPRDGVPRNPEAWLLTAARRRIIDRARHQHVQAESAPTLELIAGEADRTTAPDPIPDERLKLLFVCAHPAIDPDIHTPLMLQAVLGLDAAAIGRAFLVSPAAMAQRLVRAKTKIREAAVAFEVPEPHELPERLQAVLDAIYAAYGNSWEDASGADLRARGLADEAIWLARVLSTLLPEEPEVRGLLALMLHCEARRPARRDADGRFVPLSAQDTRLWDAAMIAEAERELAAVAGKAQPGRFQLEAAIQSAHAERARSGRTDWSAVAWFYERLVELSPALGACVGRAAAVAEVRGPESGLSLLDAIDGRSVASYQPYWAVRAHLLQRLGRGRQATEAFERAIRLTEDGAVRRFLEERRGSAGFPGHVEMRRHGSS